VGSRRSRGRLSLRSGSSGPSLARGMRGDAPHRRADGPGCTALEGNRSTARVRVRMRGSSSVATYAGVARGWTTGSVVLLRRGEPRLAEQPRVVRPWLNAVGLLSRDSAGLGGSPRGRVGLLGLPRVSREAPIVGPRSGQGHRGQGIGAGAFGLGCRGLRSRGWGLGVGAWALGLGRWGLADGAGVLGPGRRARGGRASAGGSRWRDGVVGVRVGTVGRCRPLGAGFDGGPRTCACGRCLGRAQAGWAQDGASA
jgi:hypothetical protein